MGQKSLAERLGITLEEAKRLYAQYFAAFSRIASWQHVVTARGKRLGFAETRFGRKYTVWELQSDNRGTYAKGERVLTNAPIQGGAADYMKMAMVRSVEGGPDLADPDRKRLPGLREAGWWMDKCTIVANLHDALTFEVSNELDPAEVRAFLEPLVVFPVPGFPKIVADWEVGQRWGSSKKWKVGMVSHWDGEHWTLMKEGDNPEPSKMAVVSQISTVEEAQEPVPAPPQLSLVTVEESPHRTCGRVTVGVEANPTRERFVEFLKFVGSRPGEKEVWFRCPLGEKKIGLSSLTVADQGRITLLLGGASVTEELGDMEIAALAANLSA